MVYAGVALCACGTQAAQRRLFQCRAGLQTHIRFAVCEVYLAEKKDYFAGTYYSVEAATGGALPRPTQDSKNGYPVLLAHLQMELMFCDGINPRAQLATPAWVFLTYDSRRPESVMSAVSLSGGDFG